MPQSTRSVRHSSASTVPSQDLNIHFNKRPHHHIQHHQHHLAVNNNPVHRHQGVYLSPNPSSAGPQAPLAPMYGYPTPQNGAYPHTPNSMVHREVDEDYDSASGTDGMNGEVNPYHRMQMQQPKYQPPHQYHSHNGAGNYPHPNADPVAYYSPNLPTPAVSPASSCSPPNLPPPNQYGQQGTGHHSPSSAHANTSSNSHQPTPYQAPHPPNPQHPQPIHYAAAYSGHRMYTMGNEVDQSNQSYVPRMHTYPSSQTMPMSSEGTHGLGISMGQNMKVEVSTPMGTAW